MKLLLCLCLSMSFLASSALYQSDDRVLLSSVKNSLIKQLGKRVALLTFSNDAQTQARGFGRLYSLLGKNYLTGQNIKKSISRSYGSQACSDIKFGKAFRAGNCSAFMIESNTVITAGHCLSQFVANRLNLPKKFRLKTSLKIDAYPFLKDIKLIFNHKGKQGGMFGYYKINNDSLYSVVEISKLSDGHYKDDYAVLKLDRHFHESIAPIKIKSSNEAIMSSEVATIGHPLGLPLIYTNNGLLKNQYIYQFTTTLDTFEGSSGSVVFDNKTGQVLGLVSIGTGPSFENRKGAQCLDYKSYQGYSDYSSSIVYAHRIFKQTNLDEIFMQALSNGNITGDVRDLTYSAEDFREMYSNFKDFPVSFYYEAILAYMNFRTTDSIEFLLKEKFPVDKFACSKIFELSESSQYFKDLAANHCGLNF